MDAAEVGPKFVALNAPYSTLRMFSAMISAIGILIKYEAVEMTGRTDA